MASDEKAKLKKLREERKDYIKKAKEMIKEQNRLVKIIKEQLKDSPKTVPEISQATDLPTWEVMWYVTALKKYGVVEEGEQDGSYFKYQLVTKDT